MFYNPSYLIFWWIFQPRLRSLNLRRVDCYIFLADLDALSPTGFSFLAIKQWNALPNDIKSVTELRVFKRRLKEFFISQYDWYCWILSDGFLPCLRLWFVTLFHDFKIFYILSSYEFFVLKDPVGKKFFCDFYGLSSEASFTFHCTVWFFWTVT